MDINVCDGHETWVWKRRVDRPRHAGAKTVNPSKFVRGGSISITDHFSTTCPQPSLPYTLPALSSCRHNNNRSANPAHRQAMRSPLYLYGPPLLYIPSAAPFRAGCSSALSRSSLLIQDIIIFLYRR